MDCPNCNNRMEILPDVFQSSGHAWYGCRPCNKVVVQKYDSLTGRKIGPPEPYRLNYNAYMTLYAQKKGGV